MSKLPGTRVIGVSSSVTRGSCPVMTGASLTGVTVNVKATCALAVPSVTVRVMVATPLLSGAGVIRTVRVLLLPKKIIFASGTRVLLLELAVTVSALAAVSASAIVNDIEPVGTSSAMVCAGIAVMVGASLTDVTVN